jgi:hypothetical protein
MNTDKKFNFVRPSLRVYRFCEISVGDIFFVPGRTCDLLMRTTLAVEHSTSGAKNVNCVNIHSGVMDLIRADAEVHLYDVEFKIKIKES